MLINKEYFCGTLQSVGSITMIILNIKTLKSTLNDIKELKKLEYENLSTNIIDSSKIISQDIIQPNSLLIKEKC